MQDRVNSVNALKSLSLGAKLSEYLANKDLSFSASTDLIKSLTGADHLVVSTPTNCYEKTIHFDTSSLEKVIAHVIQK